MSPPRCEILPTDSLPQADAKRNLNAVMDALDFFAKENIAVTVTPTVTKKVVKYSVDLCCFAKKEAA